jgi:hypothetical protein
MQPASLYSTPIITIIDITALQSFLEAYEPVVMVENFEFSFDRERNDEMMGRKHISEDFVKEQSGK